MKYIDADKLRAEIERRLKNIRDYMTGTGMKYKGPKYYKAQGKESAYDALLNILDSLPDEPVNEDLEEAVDNYIENVRYFPDDEREIVMELAKYFYELGRKDMKDEFEKNRLAACDSLTKEEYDREMDFTTEFIEKHHRTPTFSDAINYGMRLQKRKMMKIITKDDNLEEAGAQYVKTCFRDIDWTPDVIKSCLEEAFISGGEYVFKQIKDE